MKVKAVSGIMLTLLLIGMLTVAFNIQPVKASGTIYISSDYTFTSNIYEPIVVTADNIIIDGAGYTLQGTGSGIGIDLAWRSNVTIKNTEIKSFEDGIKLYYSSNNTLRNNDASNNKYNFGVSGPLLSHHIHDIDDSNTVDGKPVYYWVNRRDMAVPLDAGWIALIKCTRMTVKNLKLTNNKQGILLAFTTNSTITKNNITDNGYGIELYESSNNTVSGNNITNNGDGILLGLSSNNSIFGNNITNNEWHGIFSSRSYNNTISGNKITNNERHGIQLCLSSNYAITGNNITNNLDGIRLEYSSNNSVLVNNIANNDYGIWLGVSSYNSIYHNSFVNNTDQVYEHSWYYPVFPPSINVWDNGYPSGGNHWSDYTGVDVKSGPNQDQPCSDGIGDNPRVIDENNQDNYPLMNPWFPPSYTLVIFSSPTGVTFTVDGVSPTTPWSGTYSEGASVSLVMPETHDGYIWSHWLEDGDTNRTKTVTLDTIITMDRVVALTGVFTLLGDLNKDGKVDIDDIVTAALSFGSYPTHPRWNPIADLTKDDKVDIDDVVLVAVHFGEFI